MFWFTVACFSSLVEALFLSGPLNKHMDRQVGRKVEMKVGASRSFPLVCMWVHLPLFVIVTCIFFRLLEVCHHLCLDTTYMSTASPLVYHSEYKEYSGCPV